MNFQDKLNQYVGGEADYTSLMNIVLNNRSKDWYEELGKYIVSQMDISKVPQLEFFADKIQTGAVKKVKDFAGFRDRTMSSIGIFFLTSVLDMATLTKIIGDPLLHNEFGEGFDQGERYYSKPRIRADYASWFLTINGIDLHIGCDHRGTSIEIGVPFNNETGEVSDVDAKKVFEVLKGLVDLYKKEIYI